MGGLSTRRSWAARYAAAITEASAELASVANAASNLSSFHCSKFWPLGEKLADEKFFAIADASGRDKEILSAIAPRSRGLSGVSLKESIKTLQSTVSNSTLTPQACLKLSCRYS